jgi:hypothetical protein
VPVEAIALLAGHNQTATTELELAERTCLARYQR